MKGGRGRKGRDIERLKAFGDFIENIYLNDGRTNEGRGRKKRTQRKRKMERRERKT